MLSPHNLTFPLRAATVGAAALRGLNISVVAQTARGPLSTLPPYRVFSATKHRHYRHISSITATDTMRALTYSGKGTFTVVEDHPKPLIQSPTDAIVKVTHSTICGTDLHILRGHVPTCTPGRVLGHEGVGVIEELGSNVSGFRQGDLVLISCISSCGTCGPCRRGMTS